MRLIKLLLSSLLMTGPVLSADTSLVDNEIEAVEHLLDSTQKQLQSQRELLERMQQFKFQKERFSAGQESKTLVLEMVTNASRILEIITDNHLQHLFSKDYLDELHLFSSIASKRTRNDKNKKNASRLPVP